MTILDHPAALGNFGRGRKAKIALIVLHTMEGTLAGTTAWFANPEAHASAHYGVSVDGLIYRFVRDEDCAWHAGNGDVNNVSIGIELEGHEDDPDAFTPRLMASLTELCADLCNRYGIVPDRKYLMGHCDVPDPRHVGQHGGWAHHSDPGAHFKWDQFLADVERAIPRVDNA